MTWIRTASTRRRVLSLGQTIYLIIEQHNIDIYIASYGVDKVVAADSKSVAVTRNLPYGHLGIGNLEACRDGGCTSVDGMETIGVHVIGQTGRASDAGDDGSAVRRYADFGHGLVQGVEDGVVAAAGTPAHGLVTLKSAGVYAGVFSCVCIILYD